MRRVPRRLLAGAILLLWLGMVGWQIRREYFRPELARLAEAALSLAPGVNFYTLNMGGRTVGLATSRLDTVPGGSCWRTSSPWSSRPWARRGRR